MVKLRVRQAGHVSHMEEEIICRPTGCWWENLKGRDCLEEVRTYGGNIKADLK